jgi:RNA polymerase sigma-70 factor (ECF subfamily)
MAVNVINAKNVWDDFSHRLKKFIVKHVQNDHDAEDILQEVFYKIHTNVRHLNEQDKLQTWVFRITRNAISDHYRRRVTKTEPLDALKDAPGGAVAPDIPTYMDVCVKPLIRLLPPKYCEALLLTEFEGLTQQELADRLGISLSGAKSRVQRAKEQLKELLLSCCTLEKDHLGNIMGSLPKEHN